MTEASAREKSRQQRGPRARRVRGADGDGERARRAQGKSTDVGGVSPKREPDLRDLSLAQASSVLGLGFSGTGSRAVFGLS
ncbi:hypothetical protein NDU88_008230 [Pleurodeles waltl]|uniref:Uncharacterized protein n=1 Tax=Pleurodeles waltl TaxID=8319 RepID=A0AAV7PVL9_PLEWA|nr:hypothetical protein NDU88_008230 [Pleurodeles waltl]